MFKSSGNFLRLAFISAMMLILSVFVVANVSADVVVPGCTLSFPIQTGWAVTGTSVNVNTVGHIGRAFSTLRPKPGQPGKVVYAPAQFTVTADTTAGLFNGATTACSNGELYLHIQYAGSVGSGWALMSSVNDPLYGPGYWLLPGPISAAPTPVPTVAPTAVPPAAVACTANPNNTANSFPTSFPTITATTTGHIGAVFSTLRPSIGAPDSASKQIFKANGNPAFQVLASRAVGGFCWLNIKYTSGPTGVNGATGWALESQVFPDGVNAAGRWLIP
jgi:hypothetical protein